MGPISVTSATAAWEWMSGSATGSSLVALSFDRDCTLGSRGGASPRSDDPHRPVPGVPPVGDMPVRPLAARAASGGGSKRPPVPPAAPALAAPEAPAVARDRLV